jgi:hypothetical protein
MKRSCGAFLILALASAVLSAQSSGATTPTASLAQPHVLNATSRINLGIPMFGFTGHALCDASGTLFFDIGHPAGKEGVYLSIQPTTLASVVYRLPNAYTTQGNAVWTVTPNGTIYVLHRDDFSQYSVVRFKTSTVVDYVSRLLTPSGADIQRIAVTDSGMIFAGGFFPPESPADESRRHLRGFAAVFDDSGRMVSDRSAGAPEYDQIEAEKHPLDGDVIAGADGNFYVLGSTKVDVIDQSGTMQASYKVSKPNAQAITSRIVYSDRVLSILFDTPVWDNSGHALKIDEVGILLNAQTGEQLGAYSFDSATTGNVICYRSGDGYYLMAIDKDMAAIDVVPTQ